MATAISDHISKTLLRKDYAGLDRREQDLIDRIVELAPQPAPGPAKPSWLDELADRIALGISSWWFIAGIVLLMISWFLVNSPLMARSGLAVDPYPYTFLKLMLSILAVIQGPIILISQHHTDASKRAAKSYDSAIAMHAKLEILRLHERFDGFEAALSERRLDSADARAVSFASMGAQGPHRPSTANGDWSDPASHALRRLAAHRRRGERGARPRSVGLPTPQVDIH
jgi:uncharacterized membrane protein